VAFAATTIHSAVHSARPDIVASVPRLIDTENVRLTASQVGSSRFGWFSFQPLYDWIVAEEPDLLD
jgi:hypothetical protein